MQAVMEQREKELYSVKEAAAFLGLSVSTIRRYIYDRRLPAYRIAGERMLRIKRDDLEALLEPLGEENLDGNR